MEAVSRRGFDATIEEIAELSGVSTRTVFRHYASHDALIVAVVKEMFEECGGPIEGMPSPAEDFPRWLEMLALTIHTRNLEILGDAFWDIHSRKGDPSAVLDEVDQLRRASRVRGVSHLVNVAWEAAGGKGRPSQELLLAFGLTFSAFTTQALVIDFDQTPAQIAALTTTILQTVLGRALDAQRAAGDGS